MAHTLKIVDSIDGTLDLCGTSDVGYHMTSYPFATQPDIDERKSSSQWVDGELPYYDRRQNITETITIDIHGSSVDDLWAKIRTLQRSLENARDYFRAPFIRTPTYLEWKPSGMTNSGYAAIIGGKIDPHSLNGTIDNNRSEADHLAFVIEGVTVEIEREPFWRSLAPVPSATITNWARQEISAATQSVFTSTVITGVAGDMPALARLEIIYGNAAINSAYVSLSSASRHGGNHGAEHANLRLAGAGGLGTDTTADADATAMGYPDGAGAGHKRITCTFATDITSVMRVIYAVDSTGQALNLRGSYRCFLRAKTTAAGQPLVSLAWSTEAGAGSFTTIGGSGMILPTTTIGSASAASGWKFYDVGTIDTESSQPSLYTTAALDYGIKQIKVLASGPAATDLYMDGIALIPLDESFMYIGAVALDATHKYVFDNISPIPAGHTIVETTNISNAVRVEARGNIMIMPGDSKLSILTVDGETTNDFDVSLYVVERYNAPRGAG